MIPSAGEVLAEIVDAIADGEITEAEARVLVATILDAAVPTGPADPWDSPVWAMAVGHVWALLSRRSAAELLAAADVAEAGGRPRRAARLRARAARRAA